MKTRVLPQDLPTVDEFAPPSAKPVLNLIDSDQLQKRVERVVTQPPEVIKRIKEILK